MVLSNIDLHRSSNTSKSSSNTLKVRDLDRSLFIESLDIISESDKFFNDTLKDMHIKVTLSESKDLVFLNEFTVKDLITNVIDLFIDAIKKIFGVFKNIFNRLFDADKVIKKYESKIKNMTGEFNLSFSRYNYSIYNDIPDINLNHVFNDTYNDLQKKLGEVKRLKTSNERIQRMELINSDIQASYNEGYYATIRAKALKMKGGISEDDYSTELFNVFRDGGGQISSKINCMEATIVYDRYMRHNETLKSVDKLKQDTIKAAEDTKKKVNSLTLGLTMTDTEQATFNRILSTVIGEINNTCNIFTMAFSAKCDAIKESAKQDRRTLKEVIDYINTGM